MRFDRLLLVAGFGAFTLVATSRATVFTVGGPQGTATLDQALSQAFALTGTDEIRLHAGDLDVATAALVRIAVDNDLSISAGWNDTFTSRSTAAGATRLRFTTPAAVLDVAQTGGNGAVSGLALVRTPGSLGRGLKVNVSGGALVLDALIVADHTIAANQAGQGAFALEGGASISVQGTGNLTLQNSKFQRNTTRGDGVVGSAALGLGISGDARATVSGNLFQANRAETTSTQNSAVRGAVFSIGLGGESGVPRLDLLANRVTGNSFAGSGGNNNFAEISVSSSGASTGKVVVRRLQMTANQSGGAARAQLQIVNGKPIDVLITDSLVAKSDAAIGLDLQSFGGRFRVVNATVVDNGGDNGTGILILDGSAVSAVSNTIALGPGGLLVPAETLRKNNLLTGNPRFVNRAAGNYHLTNRSPAINQGTKAPPLGGIGTQDLDGGPRVKGAKPDIGADEF
jgi:hypothetical protein